MLTSIYDRNRDTHGATILDGHQTWQLLCLPDGAGCISFFPCSNGAACSHLEALPLRRDDGVVARVELDARAAAAAGARGRMQISWHAHLATRLAGQVTQMHAAVAMRHWPQPMRVPPIALSCPCPRSSARRTSMQLQDWRLSSHLQGWRRISHLHTWTGRSCSPPHWLCTRALRSAGAQSAWCRR